MNKGFNGFDGSINLLSGVCLVKFKNTHCTELFMTKRTAKTLARAEGHVCMN